MDSFKLNPFRKVRTCAGLVGLGLALASCSSTQLVSSTKKSTAVEQNCYWGTQQFDLCAYPTTEEKIDALLAAMTLDEKLGQMTQSVWHNNVTPETVREYGIGSIIHTEGPVPGSTERVWRENFNRFQEQALKTRLGIPLINAVDAVHGQNTFEGAVIFPHNIGMAATGNLSLIREAAKITAAESLATGFHWVFAPCISMPRHEHWGRVYEGFGEEPEFTARAAEASISGLQQLGEQRFAGVAATAKHYLGDGASIGGVSGADTPVTEAELAERFLPPYQAAINTDVASVMVGFNSVNGIAMHQHKALIQDVLKDKMQFSGVVLTDWDGGLRYGPPETVINAGVDVAMQPGNHEEFITRLKEAVVQGRVAESRINDAVRRILSLKFKTGVFDQPLWAVDEFDPVGKESSRQIARQAVRESLVLLKNENQALPLAHDAEVHVVGEHGNNSGLQSGGWSIHWQGQTENYAGATTILEGIQAFTKNVSYSPDQCGAEQDIETAVIIVGEQPYAEHLGDTDELWLSDEHKQLIASCRGVAEKLIVILISGRPLEITKQLDQADTFIAAWLPGSEGAGVADLLFSANGFQPKGKLPHPWPRSADDLPLEIGDPKALYPYGFGLEQY